MIKTVYLVKIIEADPKIEQESLKKQTGKCEWKMIVVTVIDD